MRPNRVRIIGGRFRGRKLNFPALPALRPTPDRVRETVFNWLGQRLDGLRCLDLFAGSGALGFEAISRGAREVVLVERDPRVVSALRREAARLGDGTIEIVHADGLAYLAGDCGGFDVIFLDPPYASGLLPRALELAATRLAPGGKIYAEYGSPIEATYLQRLGLAVWRQGRAGQSHFYVLERA